MVGGKANTRQLLGCVMLFVTVFTVMTFAQFAVKPSAGLRFGEALSWEPAVTGHPYSANEVVQVTVSEGNLPVARSYQIYRDSSGRTLTVPAHAVGGYNPKITEIDDPVAGFRYVLDSSTQIVHRSKLVTRPSPPSSRATFPGSGTLSLGRKTMFGVEADGSRMVNNVTLSGGTPSMSVIERWYSSDMHIPMLLTTKNSFGESSDQITSLQLGEQPTKLFEIPEGYTVVDETASFVLR